MSHTEGDKNLEYLGAVAFGFRYSPPHGHLVAQKGAFTRPSPAEREERRSPGSICILSWPKARNAIPTLSCIAFLFLSCLLSFVQRFHLLHGSISIS